MRSTNGIIVFLVFISIGFGSAASAGYPSVDTMRLRTVAVLIFEGVELLDVAGPTEVFIISEEGRAFSGITVYGNRNPIRTMGGMTLVPDYDYAGCPPADIIVLPGGDMHNVKQDGIAWIRSASGSAEIVLSVCMGAFLLARAELLDGIEATTHHWGVEKLRSTVPGCSVVSGERFVDSGKIVTTAGVTAGIDGALHIVSRLLGEEAARWASEEWMEYRR